MTRLEGFQKKGWGHEKIFATNDKYCGKLLVFDKAGNKFSMHFHAHKDETWYVQEGSFRVKYILTETAEIKEVILKKGDSWRNEPLEPHQLIALEDNSLIFEVSTPDSVEDNFRIQKGDSQNV